MNTAALNRIILLAIFFPFIGFFQGIDTQPVAVALLVFTCFLYLLKIKPRKIIVKCFFLVCVLYLFRLILEVGDLSFVYVSTYLAVIATAFSIYYLLDCKVISLSRGFVVFVFCVYVFVGLIQFIQPDFLGFMVTRGEDSMLRAIDSGRGRRSLAPEPAQLGQVFIYLNLIYIVVALVKINKESMKNVAFFSFFSFCAVLFISQSSYVLVIYVFLIAFLIVSYSPRVSIVYLVVFFFLVYLYLEYFPSENSRLHTVYYQIGDFDWIASQGAFARVVNIPLSIIGGIHHGFLGAGNTEDFVFLRLYIPFYDAYYISAVGSRNLGGLVEVYLRFGLLSLPVFLMLGYMLYRIACLTLNFKKREIRIGWFFLILIILNLFQYGSIANPLAWFAFLYTYVNVGRIKRAQLR